MSETARATSSSPVHGGVEYVRSEPSWRRIASTPHFGLWFPVLVYILTRLHGATVLSVLSARQSALGVGSKPGYFVFSPLQAAPGYWGVITNWDGQWYRYIATEGYSLSVSPPVTNAEMIHAWAFPPIFPYTVRALTGLGLSFELAATMINLMAGAAAMILLYRLLADSGGPRTAIAGVVLLNAFPSAPLFQAAYSEAIGFALLIGVLLLARKKKYGWASLLVCALALTRIITAPLAAVAVVHVMASLKSNTPTSRGETLGRAIFGAVALGATLLWSGLSALFTSGTTGAQSRPAETITGHGNWFSESYQMLGILGPVLVALGLTVLGLMSLRHNAQAWGLEARTWLWAYPLYLALVTPVTGGAIRYLMLCFPLPLVLVGGKNRIWLVPGLAIAGLLLQWLWVRYSFIVVPGGVMP